MTTTQRTFWPCDQLTDSGIFKCGSVDYERVANRALVGSGHRDKRTGKRLSSGTVPVGQGLATILTKPSPESDQRLPVVEQTLGGRANPQRMTIVEGGLDDPRVQKLLAYHFTSARAQTAPGSAHALDLSGLKARDVLFWSVWDDADVVGIGALKRLSESHGEIKSMHTDQAHRRKGIGRALLRHIIAEARKMGLLRLSLETGSWSFFAPARELYSRQGFVECPPFGSYAAGPNSVFMTLELESES